MAGKKRCFATVSALRKLDPVVLCEVLGKFPEYLKHKGLALPKEPDTKNLDYDKIRTACMDGDIIAELDDVLFFATILGNKDGWEKILNEADFRKVNFPFSPVNLTYADLAMKAWLHDWPANIDLLEQSYARVKIHNRSSYVYYPPLKDLRGKYKKPSKNLASTLTKKLSEHFIKQRLGKGTNVVMYDYEKEIWFLIRYPGQMERHPAIDDDGNATSQKFKPESYDAVVYHKEFSDLRLNTNRIKEHKVYRMAFGHTLLSTENAFDPATKVVTLEPLKGECLDIFNCKDIAGLSEIAPVEVNFCCSKAPGREIRWRAERDCSLLDYHTQKKHLLPEDTHTVADAKFRYRLKDRTSYETVTVHTGRRLNYERDGDSVVIEQWLRKRKFIKDTLGLFKHG